MTLEALATSLVTTLATKAFEKAGEEVGKESGTTALSLIKGLFTPDELITLNLSAEALQDPKAQGKIEGKLEERLAAHPDIAKQLEALLANLPKAEGKANTLTQIGNSNVGVQDVTGSTINITR
ncbi:MAG: hypothetical protein JNM09_19265 [Blastocatellia bacterium]|nr:hypothetical protein [Blastocatellia bacterium]